MRRQGSPALRHCCVGCPKGRMLGCLRRGDPTTAAGKPQSPRPAEDSSFKDM